MHRVRNGRHLSVWKQQMQRRKSKSRLSAMKPDFYCVVVFAEAADPFEFCLICDRRDWKGKHYRSLSSGPFVSVGQHNWQCSGDFCTSITASLVPSVEDRANDRETTFLFLVTRTRGRLFAYRHFCVGWERDYGEDHRLNSIKCFLYVRCCHFDVRIVHNSCWRGHITIEGKKYDIDPP